MCEPDAQDLLPSPLSRADVAGVINRCTIMKKTGAIEIFCDTCVFSRQFIDSCMALFDVCRYTLHH